MTNIQEFSLPKILDFVPPPTVLENEQNIAYFIYQSPKYTLDQYEYL
jgi:hypothetical protein